MGRTTKTIEERILEGGTNARGAVSHRPLPGAMVVSPRMAPERIPVCPDEMPDQGKELWEQSISWLIERNAAQQVDVPMLTLMCFHWSAACMAWDVLGEQGWFIRGSAGNLIAHPAAMMFKQNSKAFQDLAREFAMTTLARTKIALLEVSGRSIQADLESSLGRNPRSTNRT